MQFNTYLVQQNKSDNPTKLGLDHDSFHNVMESIYLDWVNNYISLEAFAASYGITIDHAEKLIDIGRKGSVWL